MDNIKPIIVEQSFNSTIGDLWEAISNSEKMKQWFFGEIHSFVPEIGFKTQFNVKAESRDFMHVWEITELIPMKKMVISWKYAGIKGDAFVHFELFEEEGGSKLRLTNMGLESFPQHIPEFSRESCIGGWEYFIKGNLKDFLENN